MKTFILTCLLAIFTLPLMAYEILHNYPDYRFGVYLGGGLSDMTNNGPQATIFAVTGGLNTGFYVQKVLHDDFELETALLYVRKGTAQYHEILRLRYLEVPLLLRLVVQNPSGSSMNIAAGLSGSVLIDKHISYTEYTTGYTIKFGNNPYIKPLDAGFVISVGGRINRFSSELRYSRGFVNVFKHGNRNVTTSLLLGYTIW